MNIRRTCRCDLPVLLELYAHARAFMAAHGNPNQWKTTYPSEEQILQDIDSQNSYVCEQDGRIIASFFLRQGDDPTYAVIYEGAWPDSEPYGVVHRIASDGTVKGAATFCLNWALERCGRLRIDTHRDNTVMQNLLKKNQFSYCGIIHLANGEERLAYQRTAH